jgi:hypothetical protein
VLAVAFAAAVAAAGLAMLLLGGSPPAGVGAGRATVPTPAWRTAAVQALTVLRAWDERRTAAWAAGDPAALDALYLPGSRTGRADVAMLRAYRRRGLRVLGIRTQVLQVRVAARTGDRLALLVTDRLVGATAMGGGRRVSLPSGGATTRRITLRLADGRWLVAEVHRLG